MSLKKKNPFTAIGLHQISVSIKSSLVLLELFILFSHEYFLNVQNILERKDIANLQNRCCRILSEILSVNIHRLFSRVGGIRKRIV